MTRMRERELLYSRFSHTILRAIWYAMLPLSGIAVLTGVYHSLPDHWLDAVKNLAAWSLGVFCVYRTFFITRRVYGTAEGIQIVGFRSRSRFVPWSNVGDPRFVWWSRRRMIARVVSVTIEGESRPVYFYANQTLLERFRAMKASAGPRSDFISRD